MKTAISVTRFPSLAAACALTLAASLMASATSVAHASDPDADRLTATVRYGDLDLATHQGSLQLYRRIVAAAMSVCPLGVSRDMGAAHQQAACASQAIAAAVSQIGSPLLAAVYADDKKHG